MQISTEFYMYIHTYIHIYLYIYNSSPRKIRNLGKPLQTWLSVELAVGWCH